MRSNRGVEKKSKGWRRPALGEDLTVEITQSTQGDEVLRTILGLAAQDDMIQHLNLEELAGADEIPCHTDIGFRGRGISAYAVCGISGVIPHPILCRI